MSLLRLVTLSLLLLFPLSDAAAQGNPSAYWLTAGLGLGSRGGAGAIGGTYQFGGNLLTLRGAGTIALSGDELWDVGLLYGRATRPGVVHLSLAVGVALVGGVRREGSLFDPQERIPATIGLPLEIHASLRLLPLLGVGLYGFGNLNGEEPFAGVAAAVQIGRLR